MIPTLLSLVCIWLGASASGASVQARMDADTKAGRPLVVHVVVALCDNLHQGIVPVKQSLGNGQDPDRNLYWGALYGVRRFMTSRAGGWKKVDHRGRPPAGVLERVVLRKRILRGKSRSWVYLVADAWDGKEIRAATGHFLEISSGRHREEIRVTQGDGTRVLASGGNAHLVVYVGHDGLMDFDLSARPNPAADAPARSAAVLACASRDFFAGPLARAGAHRLVMTTGLLAPEAYVLDALIGSWMSGSAANQVREAAARAYAHYQRCGIGPARKLFAGDP